jgi:hypothetical protein
MNPHIMAGQSMATAIAAITNAGIGFMPLLSFCPPLLVKERDAFPPLLASLGFHARTFSPLPYGILAVISRLWTAEIEKHVAKTFSKLALTPFAPRFLKMTLAEYEQHLRRGPQLMSHFVRDSPPPVNRKIGPYALIG